MQMTYMLLSFLITAVKKKAPQRELFFNSENIPANKPADLQY